MFNMCVRQTFNEARELDKKRVLDGSENEMEKLKFKIHFFSPFTPRFIQRLRTRGAGRKSCHEGYALTHSYWIFYEQYNNDKKERKKAK